MAVIVLLSLAACAAGAVLTRRPLLCLHLILVTTLLFEDPVSNGIDGGNQFFAWQGLFYARLPGQVSLTDLMLVALTCGTLLAWREQRRTLRPPPRGLSMTLLLLGLAISAGVAVGLANSAYPVALLNQTRIFAYLLVLPALTAILIRTERDGRGLILAFAAVGLVKAAEGTVLGALSAAADGVGTAPVFYNPAANFALVLFLAALVAAWLQRVRVPPWLWFSVPIALVALLLSLRRGFWIALAVAVAALIVTNVLRHRGWRRSVAVAVGTTIVLASMWTVPLAAFDSARERVATLSPAALQITKEDRYRLTERRNVLEALSEHPTTGLGIGVAWQALHPMTVEYRGARYYAHTAPLLFFLRMGILGLIAYCALLYATVHYGVGLYRTSADPLLCAVGAAVAAASLGLVAAEATGSHTGSNLRHTIVFAVVLGTMAKLRQLQAGPDRSRGFSSSRERQVRRL